MIHSAERPGRLSPSFVTLFGSGALTVSRHPALQLNPPPEGAGFLSLSPEPSFSVFVPLLVKSSHVPEVLRISSFTTLFFFVFCAAFLPAFPQPACGPTYYYGVHIYGVFNHFLGLLVQNVPQACNIHHPSLPPSQTPHLIFLLLLCGVLFSFGVQYLTIVLELLELLKGGEAVGERGDRGGELSARDGAVPRPVAAVPDQGPRQAGGLQAGEIFCDKYVKRTTLAWFCITRRHGVFGGHISAPLLAILSVIFLQTDSRLLYVQP